MLYRVAAPPWPSGVIHSQRPRARPRRSPSTFIMRASAPLIIFLHSRLPRDRYPRLPCVPRNRYAAFRTTMEKRKRRSNFEGPNFIPGREIQTSFVGKRSFARNLCDFWAAFWELRKCTWIVEIRICTERKKSLIQNFSQLISQQLSYFFFNWQILYIALEEIIGIQQIIHTLFG